MIFIPNNRAPEVLKPGEQPLYPVTTMASPQRTPFLCRWLFSAASAGRDHFNPGRRQLYVRRVAVISIVADQPPREPDCEAFEESVRAKGDFMRRSRRCVYGERKTSAVCHRHELRTFAPLGLSRSEPTFLAPTNVPAIKHSLRSRSPRARRPIDSAGF